MRPSHHHTLIASLLLVAQLLMATGVPLPKFAAVRKDRSQPFACMDRACGCATAEQCRKSCCCFPKNRPAACAVVLTEPAAKPCCDKPPERHPPRGIITIMAQKCRGQDGSMSFAVCTVAIVKGTAPTFDAPLAAASIFSTESCATIPSLDAPPVPPPRQLA